MEGLRVSDHREQLSSADEWSEILTSFRTFQSTSQSKYKTIRNVPYDAPQTLFPEKDNTGLQMPASQIRSNSAIANTSIVQTQASQKVDDGLRAPILRGPNTTGPVNSDIVIANPVAVDESSKYTAGHGKKAIPKAAEVTSSGHCSSQRKSPVIKTYPASDTDPDPEAKKAIATPKNPTQEMTVLSPSPAALSDGSDEVLLWQCKKYATGSPMAPGSPAAPLDEQQAALAVQSLRQNFNARSLTTTKYSSVNLPNQARGHGSFSCNRGMREALTSPGPPKFPQLARTREKKPPMILSSPNEASVGAGAVKKSDINDKLERLQREEKWKIGQQARGIDVHATKRPSPLDFARQGEGNDPKSPVAKEISRALTKRDILALSPSSRNYQTDRNSDDDAAPGNGGSSDMVEYRTPSSERSSDYSEQNHKTQLIPGCDNFSMSVVDWQHRPWDSHSGQEFTQRFKKWLKTVREMDRICVDTTSKEFNNPNLHTRGHSMVAFQTKSPIAYLDLTDQESAAHVHETARGYIHNWNARLVRERQEVRWKKQKMAMQMQLSLQYRPPLAIELNPHTPKVNLYLRPIEKKDLPGLLGLFNWCIQNTVRCVDLEPLSLENLQDRIDECEREKLPALVAVEQKPRLGHALNGEKEEILGCILASDFTGPASINRYTAELELFVEPKCYRLGVGRCLVDKLLEICDPDYRPNQGYHFDCASAQADVYRAGKNRQLARLIFILHYVADDNSDYKWTKEWLERKFGFEEQALLKGTGFKSGKWLNSSYLVRNIRYTPEGAEFVR